MKTSKIYLILLSSVFIISLVSIFSLEFSIWIKLLLCVTAVLIFASSVYSDFIFLKPLPEDFECLSGSKIWYFAIYLRIRCLETNKKRRVLIFFDQYNNKEWKKLRRQLLFKN